jgi:uncharacterized peroxidase-related enzyme
MPRLHPVDPSAATGATKEALDAVKSKMGRVPNIFSLMANSPAALNGYLAFSDALSKGVLSPQLRELIAIVCAENHSCEYCLSAHMTIGKSVGLTDDDLFKAQRMQATDPKNDQALSFVRNLIRTRAADLPEADMTEMRNAGFSDAEIAEIIAHVALNIYTNYFNLVAQTENDFPKVKLAFPA